MRWPFTILSRYPAAPNPDKINKDVHDHPLPLYSPIETMIDAIPRKSKKNAPGRFAGPKGSNILKETKDMDNKISPLIMVKTVIIRIPFGGFLLSFFICKLNNWYNIIF